jgi:hypothetical protein
MPKEDPMTVSTQLQVDGNIARDNQLELTHGPPPSKTGEKSIHEPKYSEPLKTYNGKFALGKTRREGSLEEEVLPLSVRRTQRPQQWKEQRASFNLKFCRFNF